MAREYRRIRPVPDPPVGIADGAADYRAYALAAGGMMLAGLLACATFAYAVWFLFHSFLPNVTINRDAALTAVVGTVEVREAGTNRWSIAGPGLKVQEGDTIRTRENSRALVTLFDQSTATLYPLTEATFAELRTNRFGTALRSTPRTQVRVVETSGRALFGVAHLNPVADLKFDVENDQSSAALTEGSYIVKVTPTHIFEVVATRGSSTVTSAGKRVTIRGGERTQARLNSPPDAAILAAEDIIENGSFTQTDPNGQPLQWEILAPQPELRDVAGRTRLTSEDGGPVVRFTRTNSTYHAEQGIRQTVNQDVQDYGVVRLELRFRIFSQSVPGGGDQGSEYPLMVRVNYLDSTGTPAFFVRGYYIQNDRGLPTTNGELVKGNEWVTKAGEDGIQLSQISPPPQMIQSVEVLASGHDYDSEIQRMSLVIE
jgi:hypothetical protein